MQRYMNLVLDNAGNAVGGVTVTVYLTGTSTLATLFNLDGSSSKSNPFTSDADGSLEFYATTGQYDIVYTKTGYTFTDANSTDVALYDPADASTTYASPVLSGTVTGTYSLAGTPTITAAILSGTFTGTYTLAGTPTITAPILSGTVTGTYTLGGTPTIASPTISSPTFTGTWSIMDSVFQVVGSAHSSKVIKVEVDAATASTILTLNNQQTTTQTLNIPNITATDTLVTTGLAQTITGVKTLTNPTTAAGTTSVPSMTLTGGTNLTSAAAGAIENDAVAMYLTTNTTEGRAHIPARQHFKLTADVSAITVISNVFGADANISLVSGAFYLIDIVIYLLKTTSDTITVSLINSAAPTSQNIYWQQSPITGIVAPPGAAGFLHGHVINDTSATYAVTTGSLTTGVDHFIKIHIALRNNTGTNLRIRASANSGSLTPRIGSYWTATRVPAGNTGTFAA